MSKKDRIAVVITVVTFFWFMLMAFETNPPKLAWAAMWGFVALPYWSYRFIKNNISFLKMREPEE